MRIMALIFFMTIFNQTFGQNDTLDLIEHEIRKNAMEGKFDKQIVDLNNDGKDDIIYLFQCGEPKCIKVFLNIGGMYKEQINEQCGTYTLWNIENKKILNLCLMHCCGESPFFSNRTFEFNSKSAVLRENYVLTNSEYTEQTLLTPYAYLNHCYYVKVSIDQYNVRFSPSIEKLEGKTKEIFTFSCDEGTNIIAKIKKDSKIKVLSELIEKDRKWLFIEVEKSMIGEKCNPINFDFENQRLRGWISDKYVVIQ